MTVCFFFLLRFRLILFYCYFILKVINFFFSKNFKSRLAASKFSVTCSSRVVHVLKSFQPRFLCLRARTLSLSVMSPSTPPACPPPHTNTHILHSFTLRDTFRLTTPSPPGPASPSPQPRRRLSGKSPPV